MIPGRQRSAPARRVESSSIPDGRFPSPSRRRPSRRPGMRPGRGRRGAAAGAPPARGARACTVSPRIIESRTQNDQSHGHGCASTARHTHVLQTGIRGSPHETRVDTHDASSRRRPATITRAACFRTSQHKFPGPGVFATRDQERHSVCGSRLCRVASRRERRPELLVRPGAGIGAVRADRVECGAILYGHLLPAVVACRREGRSKKRTGQEERRDSSSGGRPSAAHGRLPHSSLCCVYTASNSFAVRHLPQTPSAGMGCGGAGGCGGTLTTSSTAPALASMALSTDSR